MISIVTIYYAEKILFFTHFNAFIYRNSFPLSPDITDPCSPNSCQNNGVCVSNPFECICTDSYTGTRCEESEQCY